MSKQLHWGNTRSVLHHVVNFKPARTATSDPLLGVGLQRVPASALGLAGDRFAGSVHVVAVWRTVAMTFLVFDDEHQTVENSF